MRQLYERAEKAVRPAAERQSAGAGSRAGSDGSGFGPAAAVQNCKIGTGTGKRQRSFSGSCFRRASGQPERQRAAERGLCFHSGTVIIRTGIKEADRSYNFAEMVREFLRNRLRFCYERPAGGDVRPNPAGRSFCMEIKLIKEGTI